MTVSVGVLGVCGPKSAHQRSLGRSCGLLYWEFGVSWGFVVFGVVCLTTPRSMGWGRR